MAKRRSSIIIYLLLALWSLGAFYALKAEVSFYMAAPGLLRMGLEGRKAFVGGPLQSLSSEALRMVPEGSVVYFFDPPVDGATHYSGKTRYYLYPRKVISVAAGGAPPESIRPGDFVMFFVPPEFAGSPFEREITALVPLEPLYGHTDDRGVQALYRVL
ncbi:MAG: hypothetical protein A2X93_05195 [Deltaproteobacteria bacterium GWC2_56_8]|nr:MAG: hypothetical protein A2X99_05060 [Deltaproteobacteria bacterium GWB2_55_19]OGP37853.1 MAG: hypothetical protein A2X93_05195 [Deltaproteobacteria bacterium GWC2_56_8]HAO93267.1 hypothetical protein [Deltaproteobacteria bacterium]